MRLHSSRRCHIGEFEADVAIHLLGILGGAIGAAVLLLLAAATDFATLSSVVVYSLGLMAMLGCSAAYHIRRSSQRRDLLRRLDHAAIFVMIAGTYTPFTACVLHGPAAIRFTAAMWLAALAGVVAKLRYSRRFESAPVLAYLAMGWSAVVFMRPLLDALDRPTLILLVAGGLLYSVGACIYTWHRLPFHDAVWHGFVLLAAGCHYAAVLHGVVMTAPRS